MNTTFNDISQDELDALIERVSQAKQHELTLSVEDCELLLNALMTLAGMQEKLQDNDITIGKLRKLVGMVQSSERLSASLGRSKKVKFKGNRNKVRAPQVKPEIVHHKHQQLTKGDVCPECDQGKLYKFEPATFLRIRGQSPFTPIKHVMERLRCNACGAYFTADVPSEITDDGEVYQKYGYSARALMAISKYYAGSPFYRQGSVQDLFGVPITASTIFDQVETLANTVYPVFTYLTQLAGSAQHYYLDDTTYRILDKTTQTIVSRDGKARKRTGVYASGLIATVDDHNIILFNTNIGHAGEFIDDILKDRPQHLPPPILMSDALPHNQPSQVVIKPSLCNSHARRQFYDVLSHFPDDVNHVIEQYAKVWRYETDTKENNLPPDKRLAYHQQYSLPVMQSIKDWGQTQLDNKAVEENSGLGRAIRYFIKHYEGLTAFCTIQGAQLDNNIMENQLKLVIRDRKNAMFRKTQAGADIGDVITSLIATCAHADTNALTYLITLQREKDKVKTHPENYLPWQFNSS